MCVHLWDLVGWRHFRIIWLMCMSLFCQIEESSNEIECMTFDFDKEQKPLTWKDLVISQVFNIYYELSSCKPIGIALSGYASACCMIFLHALVASLGHWSNATVLLHMRLVVEAGSSEGLCARQTDVLDRSRSPVSPCWPTNPNVKPFS